MTDLSTSTPESDLLARVARALAPAYEHRGRAGTSRRGNSFIAPETFASSEASGLADVTSVTREARALSKEIGYVLAAADELRDIDGRP